MAAMLKAIHAQEDKKAALEKARLVSAKLREMKLGKAADKLDQGIGEILMYMDFPSRRRSKIRTNNVIERLNREISRRMRVVGTFPDGRSALMLVCARARHVTNSHWGTTRYMCMKHLDDVRTGEAADMAGFTG